MALEKGLNVFVLGAGCSANCGYPLPTDFCRDLELYGNELKSRSGYKGLCEMTLQTAELMKRHGTPTLDRLVRFLNEEANRLGPRALVYSDPSNKNWREKTAVADQQVLNAKWVTMAMFLDREKTATVNALCAYRNFLTEIFQTRDRRVLSSTNNRVLAFNYDRLFEIEFSRFFQLGPEGYRNCYGDRLLNSGWDDIGRQSPEIDPGRFCFLKLHGSATALVDPFPDWNRPRYISLPTNQTIDDGFIGSSKRDPTRLPPQPLIVFPHEKEGVLELGFSPIYKNYLDRIWEQVDGLFRCANEIQFIGYSFDLNDRPLLIKYLSRVPAGCRIVVRGRDQTDSNRIYEDLARFCGKLANRLIPIDRPF
jgi:hypothetical protein